MDDMEKLVSGFDAGQLDSLRCAALKIAAIKQGKLTGVSTIELHSSQGTIGDIYAWDREKIRSVRKRKMRSTGLY